MKDELKQIAYVRTKGSSFSGKVEEDAAFLIKLYNDHKGKLKPSIVLDAARPKDSPIHHHFIWDNEEAAHKYRLNQARELIKSISIKVKVKGSLDPITIRAFITPKPTPFTGEGNFRPVLEISEDKEYLEILKENFIQDIEIFTRKYDTLLKLDSELAEIVVEFKGAIEDFIKGKELEVSEGKK